MKETQPANQSKVGEANRSWIFFILFFFFLVLSFIVSSAAVVFKSGSLQGALGCGLQKIREEIKKTKAKKMHK